MYKVVIVDDDRIIRKGLSSVIPWTEHGFELVGVAGDGEQGLEIIEATEPHIVISDIQMPFMDGLEMTKAIREFNPKIKVILLTGYEDFKYAHEAIRLRAYDYLLKPVETSELLDKLKQATADFDFQRRTENHLNESQHYIQQQFLKKLRLNKVTDEEIYKELSLVGIEHSGSPITALYVKMDQTDFGPQSNLETMKEHMMDHCKSMLNLFNMDGCVLNDESNHFTMFLFGSNQLVDNFIHFISNVTSELLSTIKETFNTTITVTRGRVYDELSGLSCSYQEAVKAMEFRHLIGINQAFSIDDIESSDCNEVVAQLAIEEDLFQYISLGLPEKVTELLDLTKERLTNNKASLQEVTLLAIRIISLIFHESSKIAKTWDYSRFENAESKVVNMQTIDEIFLEIKIIAVDLSEFLKRINTNQKHSLVDKAIDFIREHYHVANLNLQTVSEEVHVSSAYLSNLFKVEKGFNFGDFLLETRMKRAMELFQQTDLKTYEVAEKIGYSNPQYFSSSFKKYTGYSPIEFKKLK
ncbi:MULTISPECIES: response regulator [Neobacillus]|uniref:Response regulator n=1 Tax=Neobacillus rhizophilus TaxID=2833579 RepID=A0A942U518_9BACI|nr:MULTISPECIES: response regulator [Neobacillus]MBS4211654.1 response regulator [Neobacillus rhizophilus]